MLALRIDDGLRLAPNHPRPTPPPGEALIRVRKAGICNTDLELVRGYHDFRGTPGHEFVGVVEEGPATWRGRRVCGEINAACGACEECRAGRTTHCANRTVLGIASRDGAFAGYLTLPLENLHAVPDGVCDDDAVFTEPLAAALEIQQQIQIRPADRVAVVGPGKLGTLVALTLAPTGCDLIVIGRRPESLAWLAARGIRTELAEGAAGLRADVVVEASGNSQGFALARQIVRPRGTLVLKSTYHGQTTVDLSGIVVNEIALLGSRCGPFRPALDLLARGMIDPTPLIEARYPLAEGLRAMEHAARPGARKVLLEMTDG